MDIFNEQAYIKRRRLPAVVVKKEEVLSGNNKSPKESTIASIQTTGKNLGEAFIEFATRFAAACQLDQNALQMYQPQNNKSHHYAKDKKQL